MQSLHAARESARALPFLLDHRHPVFRLSVTGTTLWGSAVREVQTSCTTASVPPSPPTLTCRGTARVLCGLPDRTHRRHAVPDLVDGNGIWVP